MMGVSAKVCAICRLVEYRKLYCAIASHNSRLLARTARMPNGSSGFSNLVCNAVCASTRAIPLLLKGSTSFFSWGSRSLSVEAAAYPSRTPAIPQPLEKLRVTMTCGNSLTKWMAVLENGIYSAYASSMTRTRSSSKARCAIFRRSSSGMICPVGLLGFSTMNMSYAADIWAT